MFLHDKNKPMFLRKYGSHATNKMVLQATSLNDKIPHDQTYNYAGIPYNGYVASRNREPTRNPKPTRGFPHERAPLAGFTSKEITPSSVTERYIENQTFVDGLRKSICERTKYR